MEETQSIESILVADCGTATTKATLVERVEDGYRLVSQAQALTTRRPPWNDLSVGVVQAIAGLEKVTGRSLYTQGRVMVPQSGLTGVDAFGVVLSAAAPLRVVLAGLVREMSLESGRRAAAGTYATIEAILSREGALRSPQEGWARTIRQTAPDVVLLVGGVNGGAQRPVIELAEAVALAASMMPQERRPTVIYAGNNDVRAQVAKLLGAVTKVITVDNVRPEAQTEHLGPVQSALEELYREKRLHRAPGIETLSAWSRLPIVPAATAFGRVVDFLWHREGHQERGVLGLDLGAGTTTVASTFEGRRYLTVYEHGIADDLACWMEERGLDAIRRWLPIDPDEETVREHLHAMAQYPASHPESTIELWIHLAAARELLRSALEVAQSTWRVGTAAFSEESYRPRLDPIIVSGGGLAHIPQPGRILLAVLDALEPVGVSTILLDRDQVVPALGAMATIKPLAAAAALDGDALMPLGTVITPVGRGRRGEVVMRMRVTYEDGSVLDIEPKYGQLEVCPLAAGQRATLNLRVNRRFDIGLGPGRGGKVEVIGGLVGLVIDARGRPLILPQDPDKRRRHLRRWFWDLGG